MQTYEDAWKLTSDDQHLFQDFTFQAERVMGPDQHSFKDFTWKEEEEEEEVE